MKEWFSSASEKVLGKLIALWSLFGITSWEHASYFAQTMAGLAATGYTIYLAVGARKKNKAKNESAAN